MKRDYSLDLMILGNACSMADVRRLLSVTRRQVTVVTPMLLQCRLIIRLLLLCIVAMRIRGLSTSLEIVCNSVLDRVSLRRVVSLVATLARRLTKQWIALLLPCMYDDVMLI